MHKLQQHAGKMSEQLEFVKGSIVAAADIRSHLDRYLDNLQVCVGVSVCVWEKERGCVYELMCLYFWNRCDTFVLLEEVS